MKHVLVTGATGALGGGVVPSLLQSMPEARFTVLTRRPGLRGVHPRIQELQCDLRTNDWERLLPKGLAESLTGILHMAADVRWNMNTTEALDINTAVSARLAAWAETHCRDLQIFCYVSTAFVEAPSHLKGAPGYIQHEGKLFNNSYEHSKFLGEKEILSRNIPSVIVRPSLILGDSQTGEIDYFNGLYTLLRLISQGLVPVVAGNRNAYADIVTLDTVVKAIHMAMTYRSCPSGQIIWAISGVDAPRVGDVIDSCLTGLNKFRMAKAVAPIEKPAMVRYDAFQRLYKPWFEQEAPASQRKLMGYIDVFAPYFSVTGVFCPCGPDSVILSPDWRTTLHKVVKYWCQANESTALKSPRKWGRTTAAISGADPTSLNVEIESVR